MRAVSIAASLSVLFPVSVAMAQPKPGATPPPSPVFVETLREEQISEGHSFVGTLMPLRASVVGSAAAGRVEEFLVNEGDPVKKGQPIARLRTGIIQAELDAAKAELQAREAEFEELKNGARPDELEQARASVDEAAAQLTMRSANRERTRNLGTAATKRQSDEDESMALQADAAHRHAKATLRLLEEGTRAERIAKAKALVAAQTAEVERLSEQLERHTMFAPFDGFVTKEHTEVGHWVMQGDPAAEILEMGEVDVEIPVLENLVSGVALGEAARVEVTAIPNCVFTGSVAAIVPQADARARTFPVKVRLQNQIDERGPLLKVGMFARVTLSVGAPVKALLAPKDAIVLGGPSPMLYVIVPGADTKTPTTVKPVPVQLGVSSGELIQVIGELKADQQVVVEGNERLRPGQSVQPQARQKSPQHAKVGESGDKEAATAAEQPAASK